jgi:hypothetical protein
MPWIVEESDDCGVSWQRAEMTECYMHPHVAILQALTIVQDEWHSPEHALRQLRYALAKESVAYYWFRGIRVVKVPRGMRLVASQA